MVAERLPANNCEDVATVDRGKHAARGECHSSPLKGIGTRTHRDVNCWISGNKELNMETGPPHALQNTHPVESTSSLHSDDGRRSIVRSSIMRFVALGCLVIALFVWVIPAPAGSPDADVALAPAPMRKMQFPGAFNPSRTFPIAANGYLLSFSRTVGPKRAASVVLHSLDTGEERQLAISFAKLPDMILETGVVTLDGRLVFGAARTQGNSREGSIITADLNGNILSIAPLGSYTASHICAAADGTVWTLGQNWADSSQPVAQQRALLRNYTLTGLLKSSYLAGAELPVAALDLRPRGRTYGRAVTDARLSCGPGAVGVFAAGGGHQYWYEVTLRTGDTRLWSIAQRPGQARMTGLALISQRTVYASFATRTGAGMRRGLYRLMLAGDGSARWIRLPVYVPEGGDEGATILGAQNWELVYMLGSLKPRAFDPVVYWYPATGSHLDRQRNGK